MIGQKKIKDEDLLAEIEDLLRSAPPRATISHDTDENLSWVGRVSAVIEAWDYLKSVTLHIALQNIRNVSARDSFVGYSELMTLIHQARHDLRMKSIGPVSVAVGSGGVFEYFDEMRNIIKMASSDISQVSHPLNGASSVKLSVKASK